MRRLLVAPILACACFNPGSSGDEMSTGAPPATTGAATASTGEPGPTTGDDTTASTAGSQDATVVDPSAGGETTSTTSGATTGDTPPGTTAADETTGGSSTTAPSTTTMTDNCDPPCGECQVCAAGACQQAPENTPCSPPDDACAAVVWDESGGTCFAAAPSSGACDAVGQCMVTGCTAKGAAIAMCKSEECVRDGNNPCTPGAPSAGVTVASLCETNGFTQQCNQTCDVVSDTIQVRQCVVDGMCKMVGETPCAPNQCDPNTADCGFSCMDDPDCAAGHICANGTCQ